MAKKRKRRTRYTTEQRTKILAAAKSEGLTATAVQKRFGVTPVTYYSWRRKSGIGKRRGRRAGAASGGGSLGVRVRGAVEARMSALLPQLVEAEVNRYLDAALGSGGRRRRR
ncbi:MAG: transposase [Candidatus Eisenbacteria bacterium]|nr:transposase [Candidatus Eisenbacteria bacterium]